MPAHSGSPVSSTTTLSSAGCPNSSSSPVTTPYRGSSPVENLAMRTAPSLSRAGPGGSWTRGLDQLDRRRTLDRRLDRRGGMNDVAARGAEGGSIRDEDWYGEQIDAVHFVDCVFTDVDLTEVTTEGTTFEGCTFHTCRFNAATHRATAFVGCDFRRCIFFTATLDGCKLAGSVFSECTLRPLTVVGGAWRSVLLRGADLSRVDLTGVDLSEADLSMADLTAAVLGSARLDGATVREANLTRADLRKASLDRVDLSSAILSETRIDLQAAVMLAELHGAVVDLAE